MEKPRPQALPRNTAAFLGIIGLVIAIALLLVAGYLGISQNAFVGMPWAVAGIIIGYISRPRGA